MAVRNAKCKMHSMSRYSNGSSWLCRPARYISTAGLITITKRPVCVCDWFPAPNRHQTVLRWITCRRSFSVGAPPSRTDSIAWEDGRDCSVPIKWSIHRRHFQHQRIVHPFSSFVQMPIRTTLDSLATVGCVMPMRSWCECDTTSYCSKGNGH